MGECRAVNKTLAYQRDILHSFQIMVIMKKLLLPLASLLLMASTCQNKEEPTPLTPPQLPPAFFAHKVVFWVKERPGLSKDVEYYVYVNNIYQGKITEFYKLEPGCGSAGCVTVSVTSPKDYWYYTSKSGGTQGLGEFPKRKLSACFPYEIAE